LRITKIDYLLREREYETGNEIIVLDGVDLDGRTHDQCTRVILSGGKRDLYHLLPITKLWYRVL